MMACKTSFELYHNFPKLAEESGFAFNTHRPRVHIEWNKIRLVDIESLIRERKFILIEQHVNDILDCVIESEFDVRILDEGVLKIFRLAQLAVEYQQFCRHYLDRSVYVLREEVSVLAQDLDSTKRLLKEKDEEIRKLRRRSRQSFRTSLPYGNDNIASMILQTLNNKADIFPTLASSDTLQHNKCTYCDKVFLNQLYLESHMTRRHANVTEIPHKDIDTDQIRRNHDENEKLINEITELKSKLAEMEKNISNFGKPSAPENLTINSNSNNTKSEPPITKETKDVEVSTNGEGYILDKIEEWKKEEHEKYNQEINLLRKQIIAVIDSNKAKEKSAPTKDDSNIIAELHTTIKQQGTEILSLKQELNNSKSMKTSNAEEIEQRNKIESQIAYWVNRAELQSNEYKLLLQKFDEIAKEAEKSRAQADAERERVAKLQTLLQQKNNKLTDDKPRDKVVEKTPTETVTIESPLKNNHKPNILREKNISLQKLQQKAQELLNIENTSTSDNSASSEEKILKTDKIKTVRSKEKYDKNRKSSPKEKAHRNNRKINKELFDSQIIGNEHNDNKNVKLDNNTNKINFKEHLQTKENGTIIHPGSPVKIIRAKITEEVNNKLARLGVDPLKSRLPQNIFMKQRLHLQKQQELKFKKYPGAEQIVHSLLASLDSNTLNTDVAETKMRYNSPIKNTKAFSLSSVISNVKTKALSLVKTSDVNKNPNKSYDAVAKKAMMLLKTPPSSTHSSPRIQDRNNSPAKSTEIQNPSGVVTINTKHKRSSKGAQVYKKDIESDTESIISDHEYYARTPDRASTSIERLVKSPSRRPSDTKVELNYDINNDDKKLTTSVISGTLSEGLKQNTIRYSTERKENSSDDIESIAEHTPRKAFSVDNITKQTKGVLKNASSTSSLNKKKVIFDMDAIQMKSVSASSPSQSVTEKSDNNDKYGLGLVTLENDEWDISSIENEPVQKNPVLQRTSPKIAELKRSIESQLSRRNNTTTTGLVGGVDVLTGGSLNKADVGGSNTSLGSSILDDMDSTPVQNQIAFVKPRSFVDKDDSEIDISEFATDDLISKKTIKSK